MNTFRISPEGVQMIHATCGSQDCVHRGLMKPPGEGSFFESGIGIVCLPHKLSLEWATAEEAQALAPEAMGFHVKDEPAIQISEETALP